MGKPQSFYCIDSVTPDLRLPTQPTTEHHQVLASTTLYCFVIEALKSHWCEPGDSVFYSGHSNDLAPRLDLSRMQVNNLKLSLRDRKWPGVKPTILQLQACDVLNSTPPSTTNCYHYAVRSTSCTHTGFHKLVDQSIEDAANFTWSN